MFKCMDRAWKYLSHSSYSLILFGCESSLAPATIIPFSFMLPVKGMLKSSSSSASLWTNYGEYIVNDVVHKVDGHFKWVM